MGEKIWNKFHSYFILLIIVPAAMCLYLYAAHFRAAGFFHDDGVYMVNAKSLYQGTGYRIVSLPGSPPQTKYPLLFPLILSLFWHINPSFPENIILMRFFSALCAVLVLFLAWFYLRQKSSYTVLPVFLFLSALAFNFYFALLSGQILSEMPFTLFSLASIVLFLHYGRHGSKTSLYGSLLLAILSFYTRTIGIALFLSFLLWFVYQRRFKVAFLLLGFTLFATIPWFYWGYKNAIPDTNSLVTASHSSYFSWFLLATQSISYDISFLAKHFANMGLGIPSLLCPFIEVDLPSLIFTGFFLFFFLAGILNQFRKSLPADTLYLLITMLIVAVWSPGLDITRFFVPLLPIVLFHVMDGIKVVKEDAITLPLSYGNLARLLWRLSVAVLLVGIFVVPIPRIPGLIRKSFLNSEALFHCMEEACGWIGNNTETGDVIASHLDPLVYLLSGRHAVNVAWGNYLAFFQNPENLYDEDDILGAIKKYNVNYLLILYPERWPIEDGLRNKKLSEIIKKCPEAFYLCYEKTRVFAIYRLNHQYLGET